MAASPPEDVAPLEEAPVAAPAADREPLPEIPVPPPWAPPVAGAPSSAEANTRRSIFKLLEEKYPEPVAPPAAVAAPAPAAAKAPAEVYQGKHIPLEEVVRRETRNKRHEKRRRWLLPTAAVVVLSFGVWASIELSPGDSGPRPSAPPAVDPAKDGAPLALEPPQEPAAPPSRPANIGGRSTAPQRDRVVVATPPAAAPPTAQRSDQARAAAPPPVATRETPRETRPAPAPPARESTPRVSSPPPAAPQPAPDRTAATRPPAAPTPNLPIEPPQRRFSPQPDYPPAARAAGLEGAVTLFGMIGKDGNVRDARVLRGLSPELDQAALAAFRTWRYEPARQGGEAIDHRLNVNIQFQLDTFTPQRLSPPPLEIGGDVSPPVRTTMVWPTRPQAAQLVHGEIQLQLVVDELGNVSSVRVVQGLPHGLTEAAIEAVRQWKYRPASKAGQPVAVNHQVSLRF